jgi:hypothetical protein
MTVSVRTIRSGATGVRELTAIADRGYFKRVEILACEATV